MITMKQVLYFYILFQSIYSYYQIEVFRSPEKGGYRGKKWEINNCTSEEGEEPCYYKDIAYTLHFYYQHEIYSLSADLTSPMSWIKGKGCQTNDVNPSKCHLIKQSVLQELKSSLNSLQQSINILKRHQIKLAKTEHNETEMGGFQKVRGIFEKNKQLRLWTVDSNRYVSLLKILGVGFFINGEKDEIVLSHTNYINTTSLDPMLNQLCDGAVSLRFDVDSENSFLNEIFGAVDETERTVTVVIDRRSTLSLGEVSTKNVVGGDEGIQWIQLENKNYLTAKAVSIGDEKQQKVLKDGEFKTYLTLSASYLSFPAPIFVQLMGKLNQNQCKKIQNGFIQCSHINKRFLNLNIILTIQNVQILYPIVNLYLEKKHSSVILNVRESDSDVIILGQPHFRNYFSVFEYKKNMIGLGHKFIMEEEGVITTITMVRFMVFCFGLAIILILLSKPIRACIRVLKGKLDGPLQQNQDLVILKPGRARRVKYSEVEQNEQEQQF